MTLAVLATLFSHDPAWLFLSSYQQSLNTFELERRLFRGRTQGAVVIRSTVPCKVLHKQIFPQAQRSVSGGCYKVLVVIDCFGPSPKFGVRLQIGFLTAINDAEECRGLCQKLGCGIN